MGTKNERKSKIELLEHEIAKNLRRINTLKCKNHILKGYITEEQLVKDFGFPTYSLKVITYPDMKRVQWVFGSTFDKQLNEICKNHELNLSESVGDVLETMYYEWAYANFLDILHFFPKASTFELLFYEGYFENVQPPIKRSENDASSYLKKIQYLKIEENNPLKLVTKDYTLEI